jgi:hypothetical protein
MPIIEPEFMAVPSTRRHCERVCRPNLVAQTCERSNPPVLRRTETASLDLSLRGVVDRDRSQ